MSVSAVISKEISEEEYLAAEALAAERHEYVDGTVYAMAGGSEAHNRIAISLLASLHAQLRGQPCEPFGSDMKLRVQVQARRFYYPDAMVACDPMDAGHGWRERPAVIFEIISEETRRVDEQEKRFLYRQIPSLLAYARIEQDRAAVVIDRKRSVTDSTEWQTEQAIGLDATVELPELGLRIPLKDLYGRVRLSG